MVTPTSRVRRTPKGWQGIAARFSAQAAAQIGGAACGFASTVVMVRGLEVGGFGAAALGLSVLGYSLVLSNWGADLYATKATARDHALLETNLGAVAAIRAFMALPTLIGIAALCLSGLWEAQATLAVAVFSTSVLVNIFYPLWAAQALERATLVSTCVFLAQALNLLFVGIAAAMHGGVVAYALAKLAADLILATALSTWFRKRYHVALLRTRWGEIRRIFRDSAPIGVSQVLRTVALSADLTILSFYVGTQALGIYAVPFRIFTFLLSMSTVYFVVVLPAYARSTSAGAAGLRATHRRIMWYPLPLIAAGLAFGAAVSAPLLGMLFGPALVAGTPVMRLLLVALGLNFISRCYRAVVLVTNRYLGDMHSTAVSTAVNIAVKLVAIPVWGIAGAAIGTIVGEVVLVILQGRQARIALRDFDVA